MQCPGHLISSFHCMSSTFPWFPEMPSTISKTALLRLWTLSGTWYWAREVVRQSLTTRGDGIPLCVSNIQSFNTYLLSTYYTPSFVLYPGT